MKFQRFLNEKFYDTYKQYSHMIDVFVNPTKKELDEIIKSTPLKATRFVVDTDKKDVYMWSIDFAHWTVIGKIFRFNAIDYYTKGVMVDRLFTGQVEHGMTTSEAFPYEFSTRRVSRETLNKIKELKKKDFDFVEKFGISKKSILLDIERTILSVERNIWDYNDF